MFGMEMMIKSLGIDPDELNKHIAKVTGDVQTAARELERQGRIIDAIAAKLGIETELTKEHENAG